MNKIKTVTKRVVVGTFYGNEISIKVPKELSHQEWGVMWSEYLKGIERLGIQEYLTDLEAKRLQAYKKKSFIRRMFSFKK